MLSVVVWKWVGASGWKKYTAKNVNTMRLQLLKHLNMPHQLFCITDDAADLHPSIKVVRMQDVAGPDPKFSPSPQLRTCYRRLRLFDPAVEEIFGKRILQLDLDMMVTGDITHIAARTEPFVIWKSHSHGTKKGFAYNTSVILMDAGARKDIWEHYSSDADRAAKKARALGWSGTDQAVIGSMTPVEPPLFTKADGIYAWRDDPQIVQTDPLPEFVKMISFHGWSDPADPILLAQRKWLSEVWAPAA